MTTIAIVPARKGSKGIKGKNITPLCEKPLIQYTLELAVEAKCIDHIVVTSDSSEILNFSKKFGEKVIQIQRPENIAEDNSTTDEVVAHVLGALECIGIKPTNFILLQPTSPLRELRFIEESYHLLISNDKADCLISVSDPLQHPSDFLSVKDGRIDYIFRDHGVTRRQDFKETFFINGSIYITRCDFFKKFRKIYTFDKCILYKMPKEYSIDIDDEFDLVLCEAIMKKIIKVN